MSNLRDKTDRALRAFLKPKADALDGPRIPLYITNDPSDRKIVDENNNSTGLIDIHTAAGPETPAGSGCYLLLAEIKIKYPAANQTGDAANAARKQCGLIVQAMHDALHQSDNGQDYHYTAQLITTAANALAVDTGQGAADTQSAADNSDMTAFSCLNLIHNIIGGTEDDAEQIGLNFFEVIRFQILVAGYNGYWV